MSLRPALVFVLWSFSAAAQTNPPTVPHFTVKGRVVNALTGEPVRGALVNLSGQEQHTGFSGSDGQFQVDSVAKGQAFISARHPGYSDNQRRGTRPQMINVSDNVEGITVKMQPSAKISGTVRDSDGEPVEGLAITTTIQTIVNGRKMLQPSGGATTDEAGKFVLDNLQAGSYFLSTAQKAMYPGLPPTDEAARLLYGFQYYPNSPDIASAQAVDVNPGDDTHIDITVSTIHGVRVSFSVNPPAQFVWGNLVGAAGLIGTPFPRNNKTGKFVVPSVPPGTWRILVHTQGVRGQGAVKSGETSINVGSTDLDNVQIDLTDPEEIPVVISGGADPPQPPQDSTPPSGRLKNLNMLQGQSNARVDLVATSSEPINPMNGFGRYMMENQSGNKVIRNVPPGAYRSVVQSWGNGANCLESITSGSLDLTRNDLVISSGSPAQPINVILQSNCPQLDISVNQKREATLLVIGESHATDPFNAGTNGGTITLGNLSPGEYMVYAFTNVDGLEYTNPEAMRNFSGQRVTLTTGQKSAVTVDVIDREAK